MEAMLTRHITSENPRVMVVDGSRVVRRLIEHWRQTHAAVVMASYQGNRGHPVLLAAHLLGVDVETARALEIRKTAALLGD